MVTSDWWLLEGQGFERWVKCMKEVNYMVMGGNWNLGDDHFVMYADVEL